MNNWIKWGKEKLFCGKMWSDISCWWKSNVGDVNKPRHWNSFSVSSSFKLRSLQLPKFQMSLWLDPNLNPEFCMQACKHSVLLFFFYCKAAVYRCCINTTQICSWCAQSACSWLVLILDSCVPEDTNHWEGNQRLVSAGTSCYRGDIW